MEGDFGDHKDALPMTAVLVVEVPDSTPECDRHNKACLYATAGITDYRIVNLIDNQLEVCRQPTPMQDQAFGYGYADVQVLAKTDSVTSLAALQSSIAVADLLP